MVGLVKLAVFERGSNAREGRQALYANFYFGPASFASFGRSLAHVVGFILSLFQVEGRRTVERITSRGLLIPFQSIAGSSKSNSFILTLLADSLRRRDAGLSRAVG